jgi:hypothetical protein
MVSEINKIIDAKKRKGNTYVDELRASNDGEKRVKNSVFYLFNTGKDDKKVFLLKYNDYYYYQGAFQIKDDMTIDEGLRFIRKILTSSKELDDKSEVEDEIYYYNARLTLLDLFELSVFNNEE